MSCQLLAEALNQRFAARTATGPEEATAAVLEGGCDIALVAAAGGEPETWLDGIRQLRNQDEGIRCVALLDSSQRDPVVRAFQAGARGVFCRSEPLAMLFKCIERVHEGQVWANTQQLDFLLSALTQSRALPAQAIDGADLSKREAEVARLVAEGLTNRQIAEELRLSKHTVKNYLFRVFEKLGISSRVELVLYSMSQTHAGSPPAKGGEPDGNRP
jgi:DNA-binding NarL/FixJ family response regulator